MSKVLLRWFWCTKCFNYNRMMATVSWGTFQSCACLGKSHSSTTEVFLIMYLSLHWCVWPIGHFIHVGKIALLKFLSTNFWQSDSLRNASQTYKYTHPLLNWIKAEHEIDMVNWRYHSCCGLLRCSSRASGAGLSDLVGEFYSGLSSFCPMK